MNDAVPDAQPEPPPSYAAPSAWLTAPLDPRLPSTSVEGARATAASSSSTPANIAFQHRHGHLGLPSSYFILRNKGTGRVLDLLGHKTHDGAEIGLHPVKQPVLKPAQTLQTHANNQLWFVSWDGHLCSASSSRPVDCIDDTLSCVQPHPVMTIPSRDSHPLPTFSLEPATNTLHVRFECDPDFRHDSFAWRDDLDFIVEAVPRKRPREDPGVWSTASRASKDVFDEVGGIIGGIGDRLGGIHLFGGSGRPPAGSPRLDIELPGPPPPPKPRSPNPQSDPSMFHDASTSDRAPVASSSATGSTTHDSPLPALPSRDPASEDAGSDSDSDPSAFRPVRIVRLRRSTWREKFPSEALSRSSNAPSLRSLAPTESKELRRWRRRQWQIVPVAVRNEPLSDDLGGTGLGLGVTSFWTRPTGDRALPLSPSTDNSVVGGFDPLQTRRWSASAAATSLASSAGGVAATALTVGQSIARPIISSVRSSGLHVMTGRLATNDRAEGQDTGYGRDEEDEDPRWFGLGEDDNGGATPSGASWDDATSLPEEELNEFLASGGGRRRSAGGASSSSRGRELETETDSSRAVDAAPST
ncbi:hypothetical protein ACM66B_002910 [Microbotryomycetes sp. NB124-2]